MLLPLIARLGFAYVHWSARHGLLPNIPQLTKHQALQLGARGETYAYWYLRRLGYIFIARNYTPFYSKGELDLVAYDGDTLVIVEVRTRRASKDQPASPELSVSDAKHELLVRTAHYFLAERHVQPCPVRFDVVAIDDLPGQAPLVRLHKAALSPQLSNSHS